MATIRFTDKEKWLVCDKDGTKKIIRSMLKRDGDKWNGKGVNVLPKEIGDKMNVTWEDEPIKVVEHKAWDIADFKF